MFGGVFLFCIFIVGENCDDSLTSFIANRLSKNYSVIVHKNNLISQQGKGLPIMIFDVNYPIEISVEKFFSISTIRLSF